MGTMTYQSFESIGQCAVKFFSNELLFLNLFFDEPFFSDEALLTKKKNVFFDKFFFLTNLHF